MLSLNVCRGEVQRLTHWCGVLFGKGWHDDCFSAKVSLLCRDGELRWRLGTGDVRLMVGYKLVQRDCRFEALLHARLLLACFLFSDESAAFFFLQFVFLDTVRCD